jgi:release factor glutamine methyltransferase
MNSAVLLLRAPLVYRAQGDTWLLRDALRAENIGPDTRVLDVCTGTGALAVAAARLGARHVTAVDISGLAVLSTWLNARVWGVTVHTRRGDLLAPVRSHDFDLIVANPPYVPSADGVPRGRAERNWDAGIDGRAVLNRLCDEVPKVLAPGGVLLTVFSALSGVDAVFARLVEAGLSPTLVARHTQPFGPVLRKRAALLESRGLIEPGQRYEELVVVRARAG